MKRHIYQNIKNWAKSPNRKPLILKGARQVGKTHFIKNEIKNLANNIFVLDFINRGELIEIFEHANGTKKLIQKLEVFLNHKIDLSSDLIFLDEIQECPKAIESLKYFFEECPELKIIAAGSYLGMMATDTSFPVGKVQFEFMGPMSFSEFLMNIDHNLYSIWEGINLFENELIDPFYHSKFNELFKTYLVIGGMPEVVAYYIAHYQADLHDTLKVCREIQNQLLTGYKADFLKRAGRINANQIFNVFESIPIQLAKSYDESVNKYKFSNVIPRNSGLLKIQGPLTWLENARLAIKVFICNKAQEPLAAYRKENQFKLYFFDMGLLNAALEIPMGKLLNEQLNEYKGYIAENFVAIELFNVKNSALNSWAEGNAQIEFIITINDELVPIEVKSSSQFTRAKSLDAYIERYHPNLAIKFTPNNRGYNKSKNIWTLPIYLASKL
jgi:predicted AAA+ superfamily ATPase